MYIPIHKVGQDVLILGLTYTHRWTQKIQNDQHLKNFHTYNFSSGYSILGMHMNINVIVDQLHLEQLAHSVTNQCLNTSQLTLVYVFQFCSVIR
jgi:hypothetical protein